MKVNHAGRCLLVGAFAVLRLSSVAWAEAIDGGVPAEPLPLPEPASAVREIFASPHFEFCHEPKYPLTPAEKTW